MILKKINVLSLGYVLAILYALMGFVQGILMVIQIKVPALASQLDAVSLTGLSTLSYWWILVMPIFMAVLGFLAGIVLALVYNLIIVRITGGLKVELVDNKKK